MLTILLPCPIGLTLLDFAVVENAISLKLKTNSPTAKCPLCQNPSKRVHSQYSRTLDDLPLANLSLRFKVLVRRFVCTNPGCTRKIFAERLADFAKVYAQRTLRQAEELYQFGLELGGEAGARLANKCRLPISSTTILRLVRNKFLPKQATPQLVGVDDFALKKGQHYGTIIIDLVNHRPLDLLPDRSAETLAQWLRQHPGIEVVTRDRAGAYADGINQGAPDALQVADHFHLLLNLTEHAKNFLDRTKACPKLPEQENSTSTPPPPQGMNEQNEEARIVAVRVSDSPGAVPAKPKLPTAHCKRQKERSLVCRERRLARYKQVIALQQQGHCVAEIARGLKLDPRTVSRYLNAGQFPELACKTRRKGMLNPYVDYLKERWLAGQTQVKILVAEVRIKGYRGGATIVYDFVREALKGKPTGELSRVEFQQAKKAQLSPRQGAWFLVADPEKLKSEDKVQLAQLLETGEKHVKFYELAQHFRVILKEGRIKEWGGWLAEAKASGIGELLSFANGLERDEKAVKNAIMSDLSNGQTEGQVNRLKVIKRQMYGRAGLDLLKARVVGRTV